jgi:hypothetical protein|tara:strand:+ start:711 stop:2594 length:1884 start_codon:yes stop_codon:yes gene_type:complete
MSTSRIDVTENWCSTVDSPTYKLTWYIVHSDVFNNPKLLDNLEHQHNHYSGNNNAVKGKKAVIIASSGETSEYSIENLVMQSMISPGSNYGNTTTGAFQFDIYEPGGFQLLNKILQLSHSFGFSTMQTATYVLKVEFIGRNANTSSPVRFPGIFYYPMLMASINASAGPEGSQYNIVGANQHKIAVAGSKIVTDMKLSGITKVRSLLTTLGDELNKNEERIRSIQITDGVINPKKWVIEMDSKFESKYADAIMKAANSDITGSGHPNDVKNAVTAQYTLFKGTSVVTFLTDILTKQVPKFYNQYKLDKENQRANDRSTRAMLDGNSSGSTPSHAIFENEVIKVTPMIKYQTGVKDLYTNSDQETITLTISLHTNHTNPAPDVAKQQMQTLSSSYQSRRLELLPINKQYDYLFSGNNSEVLDFNLNFDQMFYLTRDPSDGAGYAKINNDLGQGQVEKVTTQIPRYLSELSVNNASPITQLENIAYDTKTAESTDQKNSDEPNSVIAADQQALNAASHDYIMFDITIKGDPYWLGTPGSHVNSGKYKTLIENLDEDSLIVFINYLPDNGKTDGARKLDIASSGVYKILEVESKFQLGKFTQSLKGMRDRNSSTDLIQQRLKKIGSKNGN